MKLTADLIPETSKKRDSIIDLGQENKNFELRILKVSAVDPISKPPYRPTHSHFRISSQSYELFVIDDK